MGKRALETTKVLEFASFVSGPYCSKLLADLGAEVIKIEEPNVGDEARRRGPFPEDTPHLEKSGLFLYLNTNKKGITLNPHSITGKKIFLELLKWADIFIEDKPPKEMEELGFSYPSLREINSGLIMTSITPFGQTGPYRDFKAYNLNVIQAAGGGYLTPPGSPNLERQPLKGGGLFDDYTAGLSAAIATLAAFYYRAKTGLGQHIDVSKQEAEMAYDRVEVDLYPNANTIASRLIGRSTGTELIRCKNGYVMPMAVVDNQWQNLREFMGNPKWAEDEKFSKFSGRRKHTAELGRRMGEEMKNATKEEIYHGGQAKGVPSAMVCSAADVANCPQYKARRFFVEMKHPEAGNVLFPRGPYVFSQTPWSLQYPAPLLGQHNEEVYCGLLGYTQKDLLEMRRAGVI
jgi:crotonobetainyl-CoA:carnitine CoA-transferase CaiB-like acyl-CoA transferase